MSDNLVPFLKRTPTYQSQLRSGARMISFAGWEMPLQFSGVKDEHRVVRERAGLFDVSHMGEILVTGRQAEAALNYLASNDVSLLSDNQAQYSALLNPEGGVIDDVIIYRLSTGNYLLCVNAVNLERVFSWMKECNRYDCVIENASSEFGQLALQGPKACEIAGRLNRDLVNIERFCVAGVAIDDIPVVAARTGYTGEDGWELFIPWKYVADLWERILDKGRNFGVKPVGLGARDTLRLEMCYPLHGHELGEDISALESGLEWIVKFSKDEFVGKQALLRQKKTGVPRAAVALIVRDAGVIRSGDLVYNKDGDQIGVVTSGTKTPTVNQALGLALIVRQYARVGQQVFVNVRGRLLAAEQVIKPFLKR